MATADVTEATGQVSENAGTHSGAPEKKAFVGKSRTVLIAMDGSKHADHAFECKIF